MTKGYRLHISNFLTIKEMDLDLSPGVQGFVGKNAVGKTNVLTAVQSILSGKHDLRLIKDGEKRCEIRLEELSDGDVVASVARVQTQTASRLTASGLAPNVTPKKWLESLLDEIAINPIRLISEDPVKYLKQHLPIRVEETEVITVGDVDFEFDRDKNSFEECERVAEEISGVRRSQYQQVRHHQEVVDELRQNLPALPDKPAKTKDELDTMRAEVRAKELRIEDHNSKRREIEEDLKASEQEREFHVNRIDEDKKRLAYLDSQRAENANALERELEEVRRKFKAKDAEIANQETGLKQRMEVDAEMVEKLTTKVQQVSGRLDATPLMRLEDVEKEKQQVESMVDTVLRYEELQKRYQQLRDKELAYQAAKEVYEELDSGYKYYAYKLPKILVNRADLPVPDLEFREEELYVGDRHIDRLSSAERHIVAVKLAVALAKAKGHIAVCIDGIEILDDEHRKEMLDAVKDSGIKVLYTRWGLPENEYEVEVSDASI